MLLGNITWCECWWSRWSSASCFLNLKAWLIPLLGDCAIHSDLEVVSQHLCSWVWWQTYSCSKGVGVLNRPTARFVQGPPFGPLVSSGMGKSLCIAQFKDPRPRRFSTMDWRSRNTSCPRRLSPAWETSASVSRTTLTWVSSTTLASEFTTWASIAHSRQCGSLV